MHLPDGIVSNTVTVGSTLCTVPVVAYAYHRAKMDLSDKLIPRSAGLAAFIFVAQLINFPIGLGTSGHLIGAFLLTYILGPWLSILVLSLVLTIQAFIFQDGGILALPVNILNMAIIGCMVSHLFLKITTGLRRSTGKRFQLILIIVGCILSLYGTAMLISIEFWISDILNILTAIKVLFLFNTLIGIIEGCITVLIISFLNKVKFV